MLTKKFIKKISILVSSILVVEIIALYPKSNETSITKVTTSNTGIVYLLDNNDYVSRLDIFFSSSNKEDRIKEIIDILTINNSKNYHIRNGFKPIIPENTKLLDIKIINDQVILNFSDDLLNITKEYEEKMIESIIYSMTSIDGINKVKININDKPLKYLPNSHKSLPEILDRDYGINKEFDINTISNVNKTVIYNLAKYDNYIYYVPVTKYSNKDKEKIEIIIEELKTRNTINSNIISFLNNKTKLINYNILDNSMILNFNDSIFTDINSKRIDEEVIYTINLSINENYNKDNVIYYVNDQVISNYSLDRG